MKKSVVHLFLCAALSAVADDLYVDCHGGAPYATIQEAVEAARSGDTVWVRPGVYDRGGCVDPAGGTNRVCITKALTLRATSDDPADTVIVGALDSAESLGRGAAAVRCVRVCADAGDVVIVRGFTIRDGASHLAEGAASDMRTYAGGASVESGDAWFADCRFSGNRGRRGGQVRGGTYLRCRFSEGDGAETAVATTLVHCLLTATTSTGGASYLIGSDVSCVNCTFYRNGATYLSPGLDASHALANCILAGQGFLTYSAGKITAQNSLFCSQPNATAAIGNVDAAHLEATGCVTGRPNEQFLAPAFEDWRLVRGSEAVGLGAAEALSKLSPPAGLDVYEDYAHGVVPRAGAIQAGCVQAVTTPAGGRVRVEGDFPFVVSGHTVYEDLYFWANAYPMQCQATIAHASDVGVYRVNCAAGTASWIRYPLPDDTFGFVPPPEPSLALTCTVVRASTVIHVDPTANAAEADGSAERPYRTLQAAVEASAVGGLVRAAVGDYGEGGAVADGISNRVAIAKALRLVGAGAGKSFIWGARDPAAAATADGCGTNAVRCIQASENNICIQGFTLIEGHAGLSSVEESPNHNTPMDQGGAARTGSACVIADCVITNCVAYRGSAGYGPHLVRCRVTCCGGCGGPRLVEQARLTSCAVYNCLGPDGERGTGLATLLDSCLARQSTLVAADAGQRAVGSQHEAEGCVIAEGLPPSASWAWTARGCFTAPGYYPAADKDGYAPDVVTGDIRFADEEAHDYRLLATSDAIGHGHYDAATFYQVYEPGLDGVPLLFADGKPLPGAFQRPVPVLIAPTGLAAGNLSLCGTNAVEESTTVTVELTESYRPVEGFLLDGKIWPGTRWSYTAPSFGAAGGVSVAEVPTVVFGTNWYVNASRPNDSGDGFTPETAKRTLIAICTNAYLQAGDVIHAARGDYAEGSALQAPTQTIRARALVRSGVALVADDGPDVTFITGTPASASLQTSELGCGADAVRCAVAEADGVLEGFTLRNGHTHWLLNEAGTDTQHIDDNYAGGFLGLSPRARIVNCTVVDCVAPRSALAHGGRYERCRLLGDTARIGTGFDGNFPERFGGFSDCTILVSSLFLAQFPLVNCTVRNTSRANAAGFEQVYLTDEGLQGVTNSVFACKIRNIGTAEGFSPPNAGNLVCTGIAGLSPTAANAAKFKLLPIERIAQAYRLDTLAFTGVRVDDLVDCGISRDGESATMDVDGLPRVSNRVIDLGAAEYDWRPEFGKALARRHVAVWTATANVTTNAVAGLELADGDMLELEWTFKSRGRASFDVVVESGEVVVRVDGVRVLPEGSRYSIDGTLGAHRVSIAYSGLATAIVSAFASPQVGLAVIIR